MSKDPFGFEQAASSELDDIDISEFAPKPREVDRQAAEVVREVARDAGFHRRAPARSSKREKATAPEPIVEAPPEAAAPARSKKRRVNISDVLGLQDRYPETERAQLNMLAPVPIVLRWRKLVTARGLPAWEVLEAAMDALEQSTDSGDREH